MSIPTISKYLPLKADERSISAWKTQEVDSKHIKIINGSDSNEDVLNRIFKVVRYEFDGGKIIFSTSKLPILEHWHPTASNERSISEWKTQKVDPAHIKIIEGSDGNQELLDRVFKIARYEFNGEKVIFFLDLNLT